MVWYATAVAVFGVHTYVFSCLHVHMCLRVCVYVYLCVCDMGKYCADADVWSGHLSVYTWACACVVWCVYMCDMTDAYVKSAACFVLQCMSHVMSSLLLTYA